MILYFKYIELHQAILQTKYSNHPLEILNTVKKCVLKIFQFRKSSKKCIHNQQVFRCLLEAKKKTIIIILNETLNCIRDVRLANSKVFRTQGP